MSTSCPYPNRIEGHLIDQLDRGISIHRQAEIAEQILAEMRSLERSRLRAMTRKEARQ